MKISNKRLSRIFVVLYSNFWYIPLFGFLLGLKLCLVTFFITSCLHTDLEPRGSGWIRTAISNDKKEGVVDRLGAAGKKQRRSLKLLRISTATSKSASSWERKGLRINSSSVAVVSPDVLEQWAQLANLTGAHIRPSHSNRTDSQSIWLIFNRVPRCGGTTLVKLLQQLGEVNGFSHQEHEYRTPWPRFLIEQEQESLVTWFEYQHRPKSYDRHFYFVNFTKYQKYVKEKPIYINMLRDPVDRINSAYKARRENIQLAQMEISRRNAELPGSGLKWFERDFEDCVLTSDPECEFVTGKQDFTLSVPFFCGQFNSCVIINDKWALQMAKFNIERYYSVVGVLERMDQTLAVLEKYVPKFFSGITQFYSQLDVEDQNGRTNFSSVSVAVREKLEQKLSSEVDLYKFVTRRLSLQYLHLTQGTY